MIKINQLHSLWMPHRQDLSPNVLSHMISQTLFPRKLVTFGSLLLLFVFVLLSLVIQKMLPASFELFFFVLIVFVAGVGCWIAGFTGYVGNIRA